MAQMTNYADVPRSHDNPPLLSGTIYAAVSANVAILVTADFLQF